MKVRVADYVINRLHREGINSIFQVTGRGALFLNDALAKSNEVEAVSMHHEQACVYAAIAAAEQTKNMGACLVSTGCAATNTITGVLCAWQDGIPLVVISGQNFLSETRRYTGLNVRTFGQQEADIVELVKPITKFAAMLENPSDIIPLMEEALNAAKNGRKGPILIDIPLDLQSSLIEIPEEEENSQVIKPETKNNTNQYWKEIEEAFLNSKRPTILIGKGIYHSNSEMELQQFSEQFSVPITFAASAPDTYGLKKPNSIGSVGSMGCSRAGNFAVQNSDLLIVLGSRLTALTTGPEFCAFARAAKIIVVDIDKNEHAKPGANIDLFIEADLKEFMPGLLELDIKKDFKEWLNKCLHWKELFSPVEASFKSTDAIDLYDLADMLSVLVPDNSTIITDSGLNEVIIPSNMRFSDKVNCIHSASQGAMGFALPASIGAQIAAPNKLVIPIIGDGSIMMNLQELETIRANRLPIKLLVINNNVYSIIRRRQRDLFRKRTIGTDPSNGVTVPNFQDIANCFGFKFEKIMDPAFLSKSLEMVFRQDGPIICEINGKDDQSYIELGHSKSSKTKRFIRRPLEDQEPFIDREIFEAEMIIDPMEY